MNRDGGQPGLQQEVDLLAHRVLGDLDLLVGLGVHEYEVVAVPVKVLHLTFVDARGLYPDACVEGPIDHSAGQHILQAGTNEGGALPRVDMLELYDGPQLAIDAQYHAILKIVRSRHSYLNSDIARGYFAAGAMLTLRCPGYRVGQPGGWTHTAARSPL